MNTLNEIPIEREADRLAFSSAYLAHSPIHAIKNFRVEDSIEADDAQKVLQGLAKVSLKEYGPDYHGLTPSEADYRIGDLSGDIGEFFYPILAADEGRQITSKELASLAIAEAELMD